MRGNKIGTSHKVPPNHFYFLIQVQKAIHLPKLMQGLLQSYAWHYRKNTILLDFFFKIVIKVFLLGKESYLLECARYIERNP